VTDLSDSVRHPIGVFDSGVGGLSILKALRAELPCEDFVYIADNGFAPYGERDEAFVTERACALTASLLASRRHHPIKALVVACNTATAAAIHVLRQNYPRLPIVGVEPALKPAVALSRTKRIGVLATRATLHSQKFQTFLANLADQAVFVCQPCDGLAAAIECNNAPLIRALCTDYTSALGRFGMNPGEMDIVVLGCTHYPFASACLQAITTPEIRLVDNGEPVARQLRHVLAEQLQAQHPGQIRLYSSGAPDALSAAAERWLGIASKAITLPSWHAGRTN